MNTVLQDYPSLATKWNKPCTYFSREFSSSLFATLGNASSCCMTQVKALEQLLHTHPRFAASITMIFVIPRNIYHDQFLVTSMGTTHNIVYNHTDNDI